MPRKQLRERVKELQDELRSGEPLDAEDLDELESTLAEVAGLLDGEDEVGEQPGLVDALQDAAQRFEESHPKLTLAIGAVADSLAKLGI